jgi:hypothetical protein
MGASGFAFAAGLALVESDHDEKARRVRAASYQPAGDRGPKA